MSNEKNPVIVVGVDGSEPSRRALLWAKDEADLRGADLHVVRAWEPYVGAWATSVPPYPGEAWSHADQAKEVGEGLKAFVKDVLGDQPQVAVEMSSPVGNAAHVLTETADEVDAVMLVVGNRGKGGFSRMLLGSVSDHCARFSSKPVVIVHS